MGFFFQKSKIIVKNRSKRTSVKSNSNDLLNEQLYNCLFGDNPRDFDSIKDHDAVSWIYSGKSVNKSFVDNVVNDDSIESRIRFLVAYTAIQKGIIIKTKKYLGSILEVPVDGGYDILAYYSDYRARYYNHAGKAIVYEGGINDMNKLIENANLISESICSAIGPWDKKRLPRPKGNIVRFSFLVTDGLYFGQGPMDSVSKDPTVSAVLGSGAQIMSGLIKLVKQ